MFCKLYICPTQKEWVIQIDLKQLNEKVNYNHFQMDTIYQTEHTFFRCVRFLRMSTETHSIYFTASVWAELSKSVMYGVDILVDEHGVFQEALCGCAAGQGPTTKCKHIKLSMQHIYAAHCCSTDGKFIFEMTCFVSYVCPTQREWVIQIDLKQLNEKVKYHHFKMDTIYQTEHTFFRCVRLLRMSTETRSIYFMASVWAELSKSVMYRVDILVDEHGVFQEAQCGCAAGQGPTSHCKHISATLYAAHCCRTNGQFNPLLYEKIKAGQSCPVSTK